jgi:hypothetical protein
MSDLAYALVALLMALALLWQLLSGASSVIWWWRPRITREHDPALYWLVLALQLSILVAFVLTAKSWHARQ